MNKSGVFRNVTANAKLAMVNNKLGNPALKLNQGSSVEAYDYVEVTGTIGTKQTLRFFENVNAKSFPFTNIQQNQLQVGEALAIEYIAFTRIVVKAGKITSFNALTQSVDALALSQFSFLLDNSRIIKINSLTRTFADLNTKGSTSNNSLFYPDTDLTIPPQISFTGELTTPANSDTASEGETVYYGMHLFGTGAILNLKHNV
jgi:hypothetical protein